MLNQPEQTPLPPMTAVLSDLGIVYSLCRRQTPISVPSSYW
jgi:hypothetical protein